MKLERITESNLRYAVEIQEELFPGESAETNYEDSLEESSPYEYYLIYEDGVCAGIIGIYSYPEDPEVESFGMELPEEMGMLSDHIVTPDDLSAGKTLREMHLPHGIRVMMVKREGKFLVPHGSMELMEGDHLIIVMGESDD